MSAHLTFIFWSIKTFVKKHQKLILGSKAAFDLYIMTWSWGYWTKITSWYISPPPPHQIRIVIWSLLFVVTYFFVDTLDLFTSVFHGTWIYHLYHIFLYQCTNCMRLHYILLHIYIQQKNKSVHNHSAGINRYL